MTDLTVNVTEWVQVETLDGSGQMRADSGTLHLADLSRKHLTPAQWEAAKATGDRLLAGARGRKAVALAVDYVTRLALAVDVAGCLMQFPGLESMTDEDWAHVAGVLRQLPGPPLLRNLWEQARARTDA